jgi:hypothetical protein
MSGSTHPFIIPRKVYVARGQVVAVTLIDGRRRFYRRGEIISPDARPSAINLLLRNKRIEEAK